ncbi:uncharacterized protein LOC129972118 isoform X2 [Argiope bruennichi]|uniref:Uncharacterized protein n=2 Tax=Argiope bruennichi TaxID=94029 RepID=A0A8T0FBN7_ARGBR|nr:uncharacterized protein LOC129972118 isoform X2 [Argiope bruennichi]KAF8787678.1 hypothetical protein HNY73_009253 [Argiope bruennichi]
MSSEPSTSTDSSLLYSEYVHSDPVERVVEAADNKKKEKPVIKFTKSLVLARVIGLLSAFKESEKELKKKPEKERNIEICEEGAPVVEMDVAVLKEPTDGESSTTVKCVDTSSDSSDSDSDENTNLPECFSNIFEKDASDPKVFRLVTAESKDSESSSSSSEEEVCKPSEDLKSENIVVDTVLTNSELEQPPAKKICVM